MGREAHLLVRVSEILVSCRQSLRSCRPNYRRHGHPLCSQRQRHHGLRPAARERSLHISEVQGLPRERRADKQVRGRFHRAQRRRRVRPHTGIPVGCRQDRRGS